MPTIADRCQRFDFRRPSLEQIAEVVRRVAAAEKIEVDDPAVAMLARSAGGSFRDALATLDQLVAFGGQKVELDAVLELLGAADADLLFEAVDAVATEDPKGALQAVERLARSGRDPAQFARDLLAHLRQLLVIQTTGEVPDGFVVTASDPGRLSAQAAEIGAATLVRTIDELAASLTAMREGDDARMAIELALLKAARPDLDPAGDGLLRRVERLEKRLGGGEPAAPAPKQQKRQPLKQEQEPVEDAAEEAEPAEPEPESADDAPQASGDAVDLEQIQRAWPAVLDQVRQSGSGMLLALFEGARPVSLDAAEGELQIGFPANAAFNRKKAEAAEHRERMVEALRTVSGASLRPVYVLLEGESEGAGGEELDEEQLLERIKSEFDAEEVQPGPEAQAGSEVQ
jgi:DNA polymerase-3 subunit gamma/tau